jgi:hypothetical protein
MKEMLFQYSKSSTILDYLGVTNEDVQKMTASPWRAGEG